MSGIEVCRKCLVPKHITSEHMWLNGGAIVQSRDSRNRMVFMECENLDPLFQGVEKIIGMREQLALRGLGNILELKSDERGLRIRIENAFLHLLLVGLAQGLYEYAFDVDTHLERELSSEGLLEVSVTPLEFNIGGMASA